MARVIRITAGAVVILFASAALAQPPKDAESYFPIKANSTWKYKAGDQIVEVKVSDKTVKFNNEDCTSIETWVGGKMVASELFSVKADGIYRVKVKDDKIDPPIKVLPVPLKKDEAWKFNSKVGTQTVSGEFKVKADKEKIKVGDKEYEAALIEGGELDVAGAKTTVRLWFVQGKGIVKYYYKIAETETTLELTEVKIPGSSG
jgi:hypothetical protein